MKMRSKVTIGLLSSVMCVAALAHAANYKKAPDSDEKITFTTKAIGGALTIDGYVPGLAVAQTEGSDLVFKADLEKMIMGEEPDMGRMDKMRADHAKQELRVKQFPMAELRVPVDAVQKGAGKEGSGKFSLGGKTRPMKFKYTATEAGNKVKVKGSFVIKLSDHGIKRICKAEICVQDNVTVNASFTLAKSP